MIKFTHKSGPIGYELGWSYEVYTQQIIAEQIGWSNDKFQGDISTDAYLDFINLLDLNSLNKHYSKPILDGYSWELSQDEKLISSGSNTIPQEIRDAFNFLSQFLTGKFIPSLPPENNMKPITLSDLGFDEK